MKKLANIQRAVTDEPEMKPDEVFKNDALLLDYLHTLLTPSPSIGPDSDEIQHIRYSNESVRKFGGISNSIFDPALIFGAAQSKMEVAALRNEIESLKFKMELANLDVQVLRSENDKLKAEIVSRQEQQNKTTDTLERAKSENSELVSRIAALQNQLVAATIISEDSAPDSSSDSTLDNVSETVENADTAPEQLEPGDAGCEPVPEKCPELHQTVHCHDIQDEVVAGSTPEQSIAAGVTRIDERPAFGIAADRAIISQPGVVSERVAHKSGPEVVVFPSRHIVAETSQRNFIPASKVIKQNDICKSPPRQEAKQILEAIPPIPVLQDEISKKSEIKPEPIQPPHLEDPEIIPENEPEAEHESLAAFDSDEIDLEPAPTPLAVVRKTISTYETIQRKTDSTRNTSADHNIIS